MDEAGSSVPTQTLQDAIKYGEALPDPRGSSATMYYITMTKNGKMYKVVDKKFPSKMKAIEKFLTALSYELVYSPENYDGIPLFEIRDDKDYMVLHTAIIADWWAETPYANIGVPTGEKSGWLVLDVDDGGDATLAELETTHGRLPDTVTAVTGSGGQHYIFKYPKGRIIPNKTKFVPGLDTRSSGGLIVVSPSLHISGNRYRWMG